MYGYAIRAKRSGTIKIGITGDVRSRFSSYRTHCSEPVELAYSAKFRTEKEARDWERGVLKQYNLHKSHGEWLSPNQDLASDLSTGIILDTPSTESRAKMLEGYIRILKGEHRARVNRFHGEWNVAYIGIHQTPENIYTPDWVSAIKFVNWYCRHGVALKIRLDKHENYGYAEFAFKSLVAAACTEISEGLNPGDLDEWPEGQAERDAAQRFELAREQKERGE